MVAHIINAVTIAQKLSAINDLLSKRNTLQNSYTSTYNLKIDQIHEFSENEFANINKLSMRKAF